MQQTEKYKLNLIEPSDPFLPEGLNANTQKVEEVLQTHMEGPVSALEQRVTVLEAKKIIFGTYTVPANGGNYVPVTLGFAPKAVIIANLRVSASMAVCVDAEPKVECAIRLRQDGFEVMPQFTSEKHVFIAFT